MFAAASVVCLLFFLISLCNFLLFHYITTSLPTLPAAMRVARQAVLQVKLSTFMLSIIRATLAKAWLMYL